MHIITRILSKFSYTEGLSWTPWTSSWSERARAGLPPPSPPPTRGFRSSSWNGPRSAAAPRRGRAAGCGRRAIPLAHADGVVEDVEQFRTYLRAVLGEDYDAARVDAFLAAAPDMVGFFHDRTALRFVPGAAICDVYGDLPGAGTGHRSVAPAPVDGRALGPEVLDAAAPPALRDVVPRHGDHGRARPAGVPVRVPWQAPRAGARHPAPHKAPGRPGHAPSRDAVGQRHRTDRAAAARRVGRGGHHPGADPGHLVAAG